MSTEARDSDSDPTTIFNVKDERVLVTGASAGLGRHFALTLARNGATVAIAARRTERLRYLMEEIESHGGRAVAFELDVRNADSIRAVVADAESALGSITVLVNNAGIAIRNTILDFSEADWDRVMNTNLKGAWLVAQDVSRRMVERGQGGAIINIASILGIRPIGQHPAYTVTKAGLIHLTRVMAMELARHDIRVNAIAPGYIETDMNRGFWETEEGQKAIDRVPQRRLGQPEYLDGVLLLLASRASHYMTGAIIPVDGGHLCSTL